MPKSAATSDTPVPRTIDDIVAILAEREQGKTSLIAMIESTANRISECLGKKRNEIQICELLSIEDAFKQYLSSIPYRGGSIPTYMYLCRKIAALAREFGESPISEDTRKLWQLPLAALSADDSRRGIGALLRWAMKKGKAPQGLTDVDVVLYCTESANKKRCYSRVMKLKGGIPWWVARRGLSSLFPHISPPSKTSYYGIRVRYLPQPLKKQIEGLLEYMSDPMAENRDGDPCRPDTVRNVKGTLERMVGFTCLAADPDQHQGLAHGYDLEHRRRMQDRLFALLPAVAHARGEHVNADEEISALVAALLGDLTSLELLLTERLTRSFLRWLLVERKGQTGPYQGHLSVLGDALRRWPDTPAGSDVSWLPRVIKALPKGKRSATDSRKEAKLVLPEEFAAIPDSIRRDRLGAPNWSLKQKAMSARNEGVFRFLDWVALRRKNLAGLDLGRNIFKYKLPYLVSLAKQPWVEARLQSNSEAEFWQVRLTEDETKNKDVLDFIVPEELASFLDEYVTQYRPLLWPDRESGPLFPSYIPGQRLTPSGLYCMVRDIAFRYTGKPINPHLARDIGAVRILDDLDGGLETVARWLGHKTTATADGIYGRKFNMSRALRKVEMLRQRSKAAVLQADDAGAARVVSGARELLGLLRQLGIAGTDKLEIELAKFSRPKGETKG